MYTVNLIIFYLACTAKVSFRLVLVFLWTGVSVTLQSSEMTADIYIYTYIYFNMFYS